MGCARAMVALAVFFLAVGSAEADVRLPKVIGSHMVLQQGKPVEIWGWAEPGETVSVTLGESNRGTTQANGAGEWRVQLAAMQAGGPHSLTVAGKSTITLDDILIGEVWLGSGQSNMQRGVETSDNGGEELAAANYPQIRLFHVPKVRSGTPNSDLNGAWQVCSPQSAFRFSAVLYYFGRHLHQELNVPIGLVASSWRAARIEPWIPPAGFASEERLAPVSAQIRDVQGAYLDQLETQVKSADVLAWIAASRKAVAEDRQLPPAVPGFALPAHPLTGRESPSGMYNAMINPLVPLGLRGVIWYQGEANVGDGMLYRDKMRALITGWRQIWNQDDLSFYWTQLAPFTYGGDPLQLPALWEAQTAAMSIPHTGMAVINDIGNLRDIHPKNKQDVGKRLALWALAKDYGKDVAYSGPRFKAMTVDDDKIRVSFSHVGEGLESRDGKELSWFEVGDGQRFVTAKARIASADTVLVWSDEIKAPTAVRFGWSQLAEPNLQNSERLPAGTFRSNRVKESL